MSRTGVRLAGLTLMALATLGALAAPSARAAEGGPPVGSVAVIGDFGTGGEGERQVAELVAGARPRAVVSVGDNVYSDRGYSALVGRYYAPWIAARAFVPALGNHDLEEGVRGFDAFFPYLDGRHVYAAGRGGMRFFVLDSTTALESRESLTRQRAWVEGALRSSRARWNVVVLHHPPYSSGDGHGSTPQVQWPFGNWGADLVLSGHDHLYERIVADGTTYVVNGAGGQDLYGFDDAVAGSGVRFNDDFGALFLMAADRTLTGEFWTVDGVRVDRFVLTP